MLISVSGIAADRVISLELGPLASVRDLQDQVAVSMGVPPKWQQLVHHHECLEESKTLSDNGITNGAHVTLVVMPPGRYVLTGCRDGVARLWRSDTAEMTRCFEPESDSGILGATLSPDGSLVLVTSVDFNVSLWGTTTGICVRDFEGAPDWDCASDEACAAPAQFSPDGGMVLAVTAHSCAFLWETATGKHLQRFEGHTHPICSTCFAPRATRVLTASQRDRHARLWSTQTGECEHTFVGHVGYVNSAQLSRDGSLALTASSDRSARLWSTQTGSCSKVLTVGHPVRAAIFAPCSTVILTESSDCSARLWCASTGECLRLLAHELLMSSALFSADGDFLLTTSHDLRARLWAVESGECLQSFEGHAGRVQSATFSHDSQLVLTSSDDGSAKAWSIESGRCVQTFAGHGSWVTSAVFSH